MATIMNDAAYMGFPLSIKRGNPAPVDTTAVWYNKTELETYAKSGATAYVGQILTLYANVATEDGGTKKVCEAYMISNEAGNLVKLAQTTASGDLAADVANLQSQVGTLIATVGADDTAGLQKAVKDNTAAITKLNANSATEGSVDYKIKQAIDGVLDGAPETFDTLKEIATWISEHGTDATNMTTAINKLEAIVDGIGGKGEDTTVVAYVTNAVNALKNGDVKQAQEALTALTGRVDGHDTKLNELETAIGNVKATADKAVVANDAITGGTATKITYDAKGLVTKGEELAVSDIPDLGISKISGLQDALDGKQDELTFDGTYNSGTNKAATVKTVKDAIAAVISDGEDAAADNTIAGAKLYADAAAGNALTSAKTYADGLVGTTSDIGKRVTALEGKVDVDVVSTAISTAKTEAITTAGINADTKVANAKEAILGEKDYAHTVKDAYELANGKTTMAAVEAKGYAVKTEVDTAVAEAKAAGDNAQTAVDNLSAKVGTVPADKTIVQMIADAAYDDAAVKADIKKNTDAIGVLNGSETIEGSVKKTVNDAINDFATKISEDGTVNTFKELVDYVAEHGSQYTDAIADIAANKSAIETLNGTGAGSVKKTVDDAISVLNINDYAKSADVEKTYVKKETGKSLIGDDLITKLTSIDTDALSNKIEKITVNGTEQTITEKTIALESYKGDGTSIKNDTTNHTLSIKSVSTDLLAQGVDTLILNGGTASVL